MVGIIPPTWVVIWRSRRKIPVITKRTQSKRIREINAVVSDVREDVKSTSQSDRIRLDIPPRPWVVVPEVVVVGLVRKPHGILVLIAALELVTQGSVGMTNPEDVVTLSVSVHTIPPRCGTGQTAS